MGDVELVTPRRRGGRRLTSDEQRFLAQQSIQSELSVREFARRNHIGYSSLSRWRREHLDDTSRKAAPEAAPFAAVKLNDKSTSPLPMASSQTAAGQIGGAIVIQLPGEIVVRLEGVIDPDDARRYPADIEED